jgi:hypothetical protein
MPGVGRFQQLGIGRNRDRRVGIKIMVPSSRSVPVESCGRNRTAEEFE